MKNLFRAAPAAPVRRSTPALHTDHESRVIAEFSRHYSITFHNPDLLKLALTHRSYLSVTGQGPRESNERLEFLGDSVLGLVTSENLYRAHPNEHEGQLTKTKSLLVSKAILSRRALAMGLGRFVLMSHSEIESGGRQRLSILADAFESVIGAIYLDQGFEAARQFIVRWLLRDAGAIVSDKRHTNYKSHLQEYVQSTFRTHPVYRIRSEMGPDHSKMFNVEVIVGRRVLGSGRGRNKKEAEQAAARNALEQVETVPRGETAGREDRPARSERRDREAPPARAETLAADAASDVESERLRSRRGRRGGRGRRGRGEMAAAYGPSTSEIGPAEVDLPEDSEPVAPGTEAPRDARPAEGEAKSSGPAGPWWREPAPRTSPRTREHDGEFEEIGRPEGPLEERRVDPYAWEPAAPPARETAPGTGGRSVDSYFARPMQEPVHEPDPGPEAPAETSEREPEPRAPEKTPEPPRDPPRSFGRRPRR